MQNESHSLSMAQAMTNLPNTILCHKFWAVLGDKEIKLYLFFGHFEVKGIKKCTEAMPNHDNQNIVALVKISKFLMLYLLTKVLRIARKTFLTLWMHSLQFHLKK
jgi:hypothetical protein